MGGGGGGGGTQCKSDGEEHCTGKGTKSTR